MSGKRDLASRFDSGRYAQSQSELRLLKSQLPDSAVETLAREVLRRLSDRDLDIPTQSLHADDIEQLCHALLSHDDNAGGQFIAELRTDGASIDAVYLTYLAGAARMLGAWWDEDRIPFTSTILGTTRMYAIMRALTRQFPSTHYASTRSAVFVTAPGETHVLGVRMAADLFRKEGWDIDLLTHRSHDELIDKIGHSDTTLVGISASGREAVEPLAKLIIALRISNPKVGIFVGGNVVDEAKDAIDLMAVDGVMTNVTEALEAMGAIWDAANRSV